LIVPGESKLLLPEATQRQLATYLYNDGQFGIAEEEQNFRRLKSQRLAPHYLDIRPGISSYHGRQFIGSAMARLATLRAQSEGFIFDSLQEVYDHFIGTPEAFTSYAATTADSAEMSLLQARVDTGKESGNQTPILGRYRQIDRVAAFDDVVTEGEEKIKFINRLTASGFIVADYFAVLDREEGGAPKVKQETGVEVTAALGVTSMVKILHEEGGLLSMRQLNNFKRYIDLYGEPHAKEIMATT
jgi:orotate phosphoribosyltransferase